MDRLRWICVAMLTLTATGVASGQTNVGVLKARTSPEAFLTPLKSPSVIYPFDPDYPSELCGVMRPCPTVVIGGIPMIDPPVAADLPHVRVTFLMQDMVNEPVANGGVQGGYPADWWVPISTTVEFASTAADVFTRHAGLTMPSQLGPAFFPSSGNTGIFLWEALVLNACESFPGFPVEVGMILNHPPGGSPVGEFHDIDNTTISALGFYSFHIKVRGTLPDGTASDFHLTGVVSVTCTSMTEFPDCGPCHRVPDGRTSFLPALPPPGNGQRMGQGAAPEMTW